MNQELTKRWVTALRSGEYKQGDGALRQKRDDEDWYCCLGVLCDVVGVEWHLNPVSRVYGTKGHTAFLPEQIRKQVGLSEKDQSRLARMNDQGFQFKDIASAIEVMADGATEFPVQK